MEICGLHCCSECSRHTECGGCERCGGHPFGGACIAAETILSSGTDAYSELKNSLIREINELGFPGLVTEDLNLLNGSYVNLTYPIPNGCEVKFLSDNDIYLGNQIKCADSERCYGVIACAKFILVCTYGCCGADPELLLYKRR